MACAAGERAGSTLMWHRHSHAHAARVSLACRGTGVDPGRSNRIGITRLGAVGGRRSGRRCAQPAFADASFDIAASALVLNFIAQRSQAMAEKRRVTRAGGIVGAYVWDFAEELSPSGPLRRAMRRFGVDVPAIPGTAESRIEALRTLFEQAALERIETRTIEVCLAYRDLEDFWQAQTPSYSPTAKSCVHDGKRADAADARRSRRAPHGRTGVIYTLRANAIKARGAAQQADSSVAND
jgi:hypothetical protein